MSYLPFIGRGGGGGGTMADLAEAVFFWGGRLGTWAEDDRAGEDEAEDDGDGDGDLSRDGLK